MAWWGKAIGGGIGMMLGGPLGALLGAVLGHQVDGQLKRNEPPSIEGSDQERRQAAFFTATFSVLGYMAKADGHVSRDEIKLAEAVMRHMQLDERQRKIAIDLFHQGKQAHFDVDDVLRQLRRESGYQPNLMRMFLEIQVQGALADGQLDGTENEILQHITAMLGFDQGQLQQIIQLVQGFSAQFDHSDSQAANGRGHALDEAYRVLGVSEEMHLNDIKKAYRRLLSQHHPDKLVAKGLPEEMMRLANEKTHEIKTAWSLIQKHRAGS